MGFLCWFRGERDCPIKNIDSQFKIKMLVLFITVQKTICCHQKTEMPLWSRDKKQVSVGVHSILPLPGMISVKTAHKGGSEPSLQDSSSHLNLSVHEFMFYVSKILIFSPMSAYQIILVINMTLSVTPVCNRKTQILIPSVYLRIKWMTASNSAIAFQISHQSWL